MKNRNMLIKKTDSKHYLGQNILLRLCPRNQIKDTEDTKVIKDFPLFPPVG